MAAPFFLGTSPSGKWRHFARRAWNEWLMYLPLLTMAALALGTYWLVRNTEPPPGKSPAVVTDSANGVDYFMRGFTLRTFDAKGHLKNEVFGSEARHFSKTDTLEIDAVRIRSTNAQGQITAAAASRAYINTGATEVQLVGNAEIVRQARLPGPGQAAIPQLAFRGEFLHAFLQEERMLSHQPVQMRRGNDQFSGDAFSFDNASRVLELKGNVRVVLQPRSGNLAAATATATAAPAAQR